ncbi:MAG: exo-alpha-sialidase [Acidobacteriaceae bacterium]|nr:exo-alpha-sialidase [Acidobacteriaceae bacterium]
MKAASLLCCAAVIASAQVKEFISLDMPTPACHASTVVELSSGDLLAAWFGGTKEGAPDVAIWMSRRTANGWSTPQEASREPQVATYNPVLFHSADGLLWLYYKLGNSPSSWSAARELSRDEGANWSAVEHLPAGLYGPIRTKPLLLRNGTILSGTSVESYGTWACWIERSTDNGKSWSRIGPIAAPPSLASRPAHPGEPYGIIQPSLLDMGNGHIRLYARSTRSIARICQSDSFDEGLTWSPVKPTELLNPNSGIDAIRLPDGRFVMIYNKSESSRTPLDLAVSADGERWQDFYTLENDPGEYSYPALIQARDGDLLMTYTWNRKRIRFVRFPLSLVPR